MCNGRRNSMALRDRLNKRRAKRDESLSAPILTQEQKNAQSEALGAQQEAQMGDNLKQAKVVETPITTPAPQETQGEVIETPKEGNVLTPEQSAVERDRMRGEVAEPLAQSGKENLQRLNLSQIQKMTAEASERGRRNIEERENKKRRREALFSVLGDGISAMANLYFTSKGAPNVKQGTTLSEAQQARWDKIEAQRKADEEQAYLYYQNELKRQIDERKAQQEAKYRDERDKKEDEYRQQVLANQERQHQETLQNQKDIAKMNAEAKSTLEREKQDEMTNRAMLKAGGGSGSSSTQPIPLGNGEYVDVKKSGWNSNDVLISNIFNALPEEVRNEAKKRYGKLVDGYEYQISSTAQMRAALGEYLQHPSAEAARQIVRDQGITTKKTSGSDNVPPSKRQSSNDNVPPSRR